MSRTKDKFRKLREVARMVRRLPPEKFDFAVYPLREDGCGCALAHADARGLVPEPEKSISAHFNLTYPEFCTLFNNHRRQRPIRPISWYSRAMRLIKRKERALS